MRFFNKNVLLLILFAMIFCTGCHYGYEPLSSEKADAFLKSNSEDIDVIVEYLKELEYDSAVIDKNNGTIFFEYEYHKIMSNDVNNSIRHVWSNGCERIRM